jgi:hypothetical protein
MAIGPDCRETMHVGMASPPHTASSRVRLSGSTIDETLRFEERIDPHLSARSREVDSLWQCHSRTNPVCVM